MIAQERHEWKKRYDELLIILKEEEIKHLKKLYMAKVGPLSPEVLATMNSDGSRVLQSRTIAQELCFPREPKASLKASQPATSSTNTIPDSWGTAC